MLFGRLVEGNATCRSWREKLLLVQRLLAETSAPPSLEDLVDVAVYLRLLGTGEIPCVEDGRHYRPSHHARTSQQIHERLCQLDCPHSSIVLRKIYPWLPSYQSSFTRAEPLTRIRDIAHRNDIPQQLKREIKHTLQNKLHRCAGPEDLVTSRQILAQVTDESARYSPSFVEQFKIFHRELEQFFGARSLVEQLRTIADQAHAHRAQLVEAVTSDIAHEIRSAQQAIGQLSNITHLRSELQDETRDASAEAQRLRLTDIGLEDRAFVVVSELINLLDVNQAPLRRTVALEALGLTLHNLQLSGVDPEECQALQADLTAWNAAFDDRPEQLLRIKATAARCQRLADGYATQVFGLFADRVQQMGAALGIAKHAVDVFCEAELRSNLVFQLSKLAAWLSRTVRRQLGLSPWVPLVAGVACGRLCSMDRLPSVRTATEPRIAEPQIAVVGRAEGDEIIADWIAGVIVAEELPQLSHLGVRSRQRGIPFVCCESESALAELSEYDGQWVLLQVRADRTVVGPTERHTNRDDRLTAGAAETPPQDAPRELPRVVQLDGPSVLPQAETRVENAGSKAASARRLSDLACQLAGLFLTPEAVTIPFGVMEQTLAADLGSHSRYHNLLRQLSSLDSSETDSADRIRQELGTLLCKLDVPANLVRDIDSHFGHGDRVMVRSSANCEDLDDMAGAGLYTSIPNVVLTDLGPAIARVWASLWTPQAFHSRNQEGIAHSRAQMAVLVQQMLAAELSFIMHTVNPVTADTDEAYIELAVGLGETLASASASGAPFRLVCHKARPLVRTEAFASLSHALIVADDGGTRTERIRYHQIAFANDSDLRQQLGRRLGTIASQLEQALGGPQDAEGVVVGRDVYLVQSRPQQGLSLTTPRTRNDLPATSTEDRDADLKVPNATPAAPAADPRGK